MLAPLFRLGVNMTASFSLSGLKALITGGTSGIGKAIAQRFITHGVTVVITGRRREGEAIANALGAHFIRADITAETDIERLTSEVLTVAGPADILVNSAGIENTGPEIEESSFAEFDRVFAINTRALYGMLRMARRLLPGGGSIINISSVAGQISAPGYSQYAASKAAVDSLTRTAAIELAAHGIRVNAIAPGSIETAMVPPDHPERKISAAYCPLGRIGKPEEVAALAHFLASPDSAYLTGQVITLDGGMMTGFTGRAIELAVV